MRCRGGYEEERINQLIKEEIKSKWQSLAANTPFDESSIRENSNYWLSMRVLTSQGGILSW